MRGVRENASGGERSRGRKRNGLRPLAKQLIVCMVLAAVLLFLYRYFHIEKFSVTGVSYYTEEEIREKLITAPLKENALYLFLSHKYGRQENIPFIQELDLVLTAHDEIAVTVYEKKLIACAKYMSEYLYFDKDGVVVESASEKMKKVPLVTGVRFDEMTLYQPLVVQDPDIFKKILALSQSIERYQLPIDRIAFDPKQEVTLYSGEIKILLGKRDLYDVQIAELSNLLKEARKKKLKGTLNMLNFEEGQGEVFFNEN